MLSPLLVVLPILLAALVLAACGEVDDVGRNDPGERRGPAEDGVSRVVRVDAALVLRPLAKRAGEAVGRSPGVDVEERTADSAEVLARLCARKVEVALSDRRLTEAEREVCEANGVTPVRSLVAYHVVALYRSAGLRIRCLTVNQLRRLWRPASEVERWGDLGPGLPDRPVRLITYPPTSAAYELFARQIAGDEHPLRKDARSVENRLHFEREVRSTPGSLGVGPYSRSLTGERPQLVAVDGGRGCVTPSRETVQSGRYRPLSAPLFMYSTRRALERDPVRDFVDYVLDNPREAAQYAGVVPPERSEYPEAEPRS